MEYQKPLVGRIVYYFHNDPENLYTKYNGADFLPAIIVQEFGTHLANIVVFNYDGSITPQLSVRHESQEIGSQGHWTWLPRV